MKNQVSMEFVSRVARSQDFYSPASKNNSVFSEIVKGTLTQTSPKNIETDLEKEKAFPQELQPPVLINMTENNKTENRSNETFTNQTIQSLSLETEKLASGFKNLLKAEDKWKFEEVSEDKETYPVTPFFIAQYKTYFAGESLDSENGVYIANEDKTMEKHQMTPALNGTSLGTSNANKETEQTKYHAASIDPSGYSKLVTNEEATIIENLTPKLLSFVQELISDWNGNSITVKDSNNLERLMKQWTAVQKQLSTSTTNSQFIFNDNSKSDLKTKTILHNLLNTYQKRTVMGNTGKYNSEATVSSTDVSKWFKRALERFTESDDMSTKEIKFTGAATSPMNKIEQLTIHLQQTNQKADNEDLIKEFERVLQSSKFLQTKGTTELLLKIKPVNLGEMTLKMVEINGEMTVKISVTSQMAKDMLEGNLHQLRHMFSPAQVTIEKMENNQSFQDSYQPNSAQDSFREEREAESDTNEQTETESIENEKETVRFSELLTVEKEQVS